jgi:hypothetical protein
MAKIFTIIGIVIILGLLFTVVVYASGRLGKRKVSPKPDRQEASREVIDTSSKKDAPVEQPIRLPNVCRIWNRWEKLENNIQMQEGHGTNLLGDDWEVGMCPRGNYYQKINQSDYWCSKPETMVNHTAKLCSQYISNSNMATPVPATCQDNSPLAAFDRWVELKEPLGVSVGTYQGSGWEGTVCPEGACFQLLGNQENWCVPREYVAQGTVAASEVIEPEPQQ